MKTIELPNVKIELKCQKIPEYIRSQYFMASGTRTVTDIISHAREDYLCNLVNGVDSWNRDRALVQIDIDSLYCYPSGDTVANWKETIASLGYENEEDERELLDGLDTDDFYWKKSGVGNALKKLLEEQRLQEEVEEEEEEEEIRQTMIAVSSKLIKKYKGNTKIAEAIKTLLDELKIEEEEKEEETQENEQVKK